MFFDPVNMVHFVNNKGLKCIRVNWRQIFKPTTFDIREKIHWNHGYAAKMQKQDKKIIDRTEQKL